MPLAGQVAYPLAGQAAFQEGKLAGQAASQEGKLALLKRAARQGCRASGEGQKAHLFINTCRSSETRTKMGFS
jgi:hypothetical protein